MIDQVDEIIVIDPPVAIGITAEIILPPSDRFEHNDKGDYQHNRNDRADPSPVIRSKRNRFHHIAPPAFGKIQMFCMV
jgi:hypothetical protein